MRSDYNSPAGHTVASGEVVAGPRGCLPSPPPRTLGQPGFPSGRRCSRLRYARNSRALGAWGVESHPSFSGALPGGAGRGLRSRRPVDVCRDLLSVLPTWPLPMKRSRWLEKMRLDFLTRKRHSGASPTPLPACSGPPAEQGKDLLPSRFWWEASGNPRNPCLCRRQIQREEEGEMEQFRAWAVETQRPPKCVTVGKSPQPPEPQFRHLSGRLVTTPTPSGCAGERRRSRESGLA